MDDLLIVTTFVDAIKHEQQALCIVMAYNIVFFFISLHFIHGYFDVVMSKIISIKINHIKDEISKSIRYTVEVSMYR